MTKYYRFVKSIFELALHCLIHKHYNTESTNRNLQSISHVGKSLENKGGDQIRLSPPTVFISVCFHPCMGLLNLRHVYGTIKHIFTITKFSIFH